MKQVLFDTNLWIRYFVNDNEKLFSEVVTLLELAESGGIRVVTSSIVLLEVQYVLHSVYKLNKNELSKFVESILDFRNIKLLEKTNFRLAFDQHIKKNVKISDCLIADQSNSVDFLCTFDKDFKKLDCNPKTPGEILKLLK